MKKVRLLAALLVVALCIGLSSCQRNSLVGTTWVEVNSLDGTTITLIFITESQGIIIEEWRNSTETFPFIYTFNDPYITVTIIDDGIADTVSGEVRGNIMLWSGDGVTVVFTRNP